MENIVERLAIQKSVREWIDNKNIKSANKDELAKKIAQNIYAMNHAKLRI